MSSFETYLTLGFQHITDLNGFDHMLFLVALCSVYQLKAYRRLLLLITAFTIGHSLTLALATTGFIAIPPAIIEFLIPVTIFMTCVLNLYRPPDNQSEDRKVFYGNYALVMFFGLIHGMGFSNYLQMLLGREQSIIVPLLSFNIGLELGQLLVVGIFFVCLALLQKLVRLSARQWNWVVSGSTAVFSLILMYQTKFW